MLDKHDCFIQTTEGKVLCKTFSFANNYDSFEELYAKILACNDADIRVELEATGHYSYNLLGFLLSKELPTFVFNPLQTNQFRKSLSLRKIKTDKVDAKTIALMLVTESGDHAYSLQTYQNEELKSLTRYRFDKVGQCAKLKQSLSRLVTILFPELESAVSTIHLNSIYAMFLKYPSAKDVAKAQFHSLVNLLVSTSHGRIGIDKAKEIRSWARKSVGVYVCAKVLELQHTIKLIQILNEEIAEIENEYKFICRKLTLHSNLFWVLAFVLPQLSRRKYATFKDFLRRIKFWLLLAYLPQRINLGNSFLKISQWKSAVLVIYVLLYLPLLGLPRNLVSSHVVRRLFFRFVILHSKNFCVATLAKTAYAEPLHPTQKIKFLIR